MNPIIDLYNDFLLLKKMSIPLKVKKYMLKEFLEVTESPWKVIGVSKQALIALKQNGYKNSGIKLHLSGLKYKNDNASVLLQN